MAILWNIFGTFLRVTTHPAVEKHDKSKLFQQFTTQISHLKSKDYDGIHPQNSFRKLCGIRYYPPALTFITHNT